MKVHAAVMALIAVVTASAQVRVPSGKAKGVAVAPIVIEVFSDFQCAACKVFADQTLRPLIGEYVNTGKVYLVHRDFPLPMHPYARDAALWAGAAARIGKYEEASQALFARQEEWSKSGRPADAVLAALSAQEGAKVKALVKSPEVAAEVDKDLQMARDSKLQQTPTMVITHKNARSPVAGMISYSILKRYLDQLLAR